MPATGYYNPNVIPFRAPDLRASSINMSTYPRELYSTLHVSAGCATSRNRYRYIAALGSRGIRRTIKAIEEAFSGQTKCNYSP
ncbi:hypothetical protein EYZ11_013120 [Aspergillus tanneri]|uniref:Uncharacterized protein n=1 Tax=Aspergillus tanneri TaxID=1220188 RepID=A0A4S3IYJ2_9EURO|nr:hypothetical protein EYZ11_013120 [Aspergillus tanneri]